MKNKEDIKKSWSLISFCRKLQVNKFINEGVRNIIHVLGKNECRIKAFSNKTTLYEIKVIGAGTAPFNGVILGRI